VEARWSVFQKGKPEKLYRAGIHFPMQARKDAFAIIDKVVKKIERSKNEEKKAQLKLPKAF